MNKVFKAIRNFVFLISLCASGSLYAQSAGDLKINEFLVLNQTNYEDDYGVRGSWIEIFNTAYNWVDISGCYITNDPNNPKKYRIPKGDPTTKIAPRSYLVFWADNKPTHGTLHLNFTLSENNHLALYDQSGKNLIDSVSYNLAVQKEDTSWGRLVDAGNEWGFLLKTTPKSNNDTVERLSAGSSFLFFDPHGFTMALIAMSVVFSALIMLYLVFRTIGKVNISIANRAKRRDLEQKGVVVAGKSALEQDSGELIAAISIALHLYESEKDSLESSILTIEKTSRNYSPWNSKIYGITPVPQKIPKQH